MLRSRNAARNSERDLRSSAAYGTRDLSIETFHAKIVMADASMAYVGSANLLESSYEFTLECGFIIEGPAVAQVADLVEAIMRIST
jgi:phosphatidylserine/phosphatidylglycerophosphate/cardiolipin synthase-like enzyme